MGDFLGEVNELGLLGIIAAIGVLVYIVSKNLPDWLKTLKDKTQWPAPGNQATNIGGQTVGTTLLNTNYNIHTGSFLGTGDLWTVFPPNGNPIVDINANSDPVGPTGQSISQLQSAGWTNQQIADMIGMGGIASTLGSAPAGGAGGCY